MTDNHPITPPPELVNQWLQEWENKGSTEPPFPGSHEHVATQAARWGADEELQACINWLYENGWGQVVDGLRAARRPKPPSLKEQALAVLDDASDRLDAAHENIIRRALESLPD